MKRTFFSHLWRCTAWVAASRILSWVHFFFCRLFLAFYGGCARWGSAERGLILYRRWRQAKQFSRLARWLSVWELLFSCAGRNDAVSSSSALVCFQTWWHLSEHCRPPLFPLFLLLFSSSSLNTKNWWLESISIPIYLYLTYTCTSLLLRFVSNAHNANSSFIFFLFIQRD